MKGLDNRGLSSTSGEHNSGGRSGRFVDIHCHCLPGLDDGPANITEALALCRALVEDGIKEVVATPHQLGRFDGHCDVQVVRQTVAQLNGVLRENQIPLMIHPGADVRLDERIPQLLQSGQILTAGDNGRYLLLELPHEVFIEPEFLLERLDDAGVKVVITHPERHGFLAGNPIHVNRWVKHQPCLQITAGSFVGDFGHQCQEAAWAFLGTELPIVVATDAHDTGSRGPRMTAAYRCLNQRLGRSAAQVLCIENPRRLLAGQEPVMLTEVLEGKAR
jgi:protein-tyrosine phosphatase